MANDKGKNVVSLPVSQAVENNAARWLARLNADTVSEKHRHLFQVWYEANPKHAEAYDRLEAAWRALDGLSVLNKEDPRHGVSSRLEKVSIPINSLIDWFNTALTIRPAAAMSAAVAAFALVLSPIIVTTLKFSRATSQLSFFHTETGRQDTIDLVDGSKIFLNTATRVEVRYTGATRDIRLLSGEAFFDVARDESRPFSVYAGDGVVRALGTAFTVRLVKNEAIEVTVAEGDVALSTFAALDDAGPTEAASPQNDDVIESSKTSPLGRLSAGQQAVFSEQIESIDPVSSGEIDRRLAWRGGELSYEGQSLLEVLQDISRYTEFEIVTQGGGFQDMTVSGHFQIDEIDAIFDVLQQTFGLKIDRSNEGVIFVSV